MILIFTGIFTQYSFVNMQNELLTHYLNMQEYSTEIVKCKQTD
jgi:hypothetical protein